jgi:hypothetical protein
MLSSENMELADDVKTENKNKDHEMRANLLKDRAVHKEDNTSV